MLEDLNFAELLEILENKPSDEDRARAIELINTANDRAGRKQLKCRLENVVKKTTNFFNEKFGLTHTNKTSTKDLKLIRRQCISAVNILKEAPISYDLVKDLEADHRSFIDKFCIKFTDLINVLDEKIKGREQNIVDHKTVQKTTKSSDKFQINDIALFCYYSRRYIDQDNAASIAQEYGYDVPGRLLPKYKSYKKDVNRLSVDPFSKTINQNKVLHFEKVIAQLVGDQKENAENELKIIKGKINIM